jgi:hypothetical protein
MRIRLRTNCAECDREIEAHWHEHNMIMDRHNVVHRLCCSGCTHKLTGKFSGYSMWVSENLTRKRIKAYV